MTDDRPRRSPWFGWLLVAITVIFALRFAVHAVSHLVDLVSTVAVVGLVGFVGWRVAVGGRRGRHDR